LRLRFHERFLPRDEPIDALREIRQVRFVATLDLRRDIAGVLDIRQRAAHFEPVDVPFADVPPEELPLAPLEREVLQVDLDDARAERADPESQKSEVRS
jgi:hypothetical protein